MRDLIAEFNPEALMLPEEFNPAVVGMATRCGMSDVVVYNRDDVINIIMESNDCSYEESIEYFEFNILGAYVGEGTPLFLDTSVVSESRDNGQDCG